MTLPALEEGEPTRARVTRNRDGKQGTIVGDGETRQRNGTMRQEIAILWDDGEQEVAQEERNVTRL